MTLFLYLYVFLSHGRIVGLWDEEDVVKDDDINDVDDDDEDDIVVVVGDQLSIGLVLNPSSIFRFFIIVAFFFLGCNISDITLRFMTIHLKFVESLDLSYCTLISDDGLDALTGNEGQSLACSFSHSLSHTPSLARPLTRSGPDLNTGFF